MKFLLGICGLCLFALADGHASNKTAADYQDGVLVSFRVESTGTRCSSTGDVKGSVDDSGNVTGTTYSSGHCTNITTHFYTVRVGDSMLVLRRTLTGEQKTMALATLGWGALFMKQSVLAGQPTGTQFKIRFDEGKAYVKLGKRESVYNIVGESSTAPTRAAISPDAAPIANQPATVSVASLPLGADIELDGAFVGNTPSEIDVSSGQHLITISKKGFTKWERKLSAISGSHINVSAELEPSETK